MFLLLNLWAQVNIEANKNLYVKQLDGHFSNYSDDLYFTKDAWIQNPLIDEEDDEFELTSIEKENVSEISCDASFKQNFQNISDSILA